MSDIEYNPSNKGFGSGYNTRDFYKPSKLVAWIIKLSGGKLNESQANYVLLAVLGAIVLATAIILISTFGGRGSGAPKNIPEAVPNEAGQNAIQNLR